MIDEFDGNLSAEDKAELQQWIDSGEENKATYLEFHRIKNTLDILTVYKELDENTSWDALESKINANAGVVSIRKNSHLTRWFSIAASLIAAIGVAFYFYINANVVTLSTVANEHKTVTLPDGSSIAMNENTVVKYNSADFAKNRELKLIQGEAFFEVVHNPENIFRINLGNLRVTDIGTSFSVKRSDAEVSVVVSTGRVAFEHLSYGNRVILDPGNKGIFLTGSKSIINTANADVNYKAWMDKKLNFNNTPLPEVAKVLEKTYGSQVVLRRNALNGRTYSASMNVQTIDSALVIISKTMDLKVRKSGSKYIVD